MRDYKKFVNYDNSFMPLNEGFFSWLKGILKNMISKIFHVNSYEKFVDRLNKMPRIILGLDTKIEENVKVENKDVLNESIVKRSRFKTVAINEASKMDNLDLSNELKNKLKLAFEILLGIKNEQEIKYSDDELEAIGKIYDTKVKNNRELDAFIQKINNSGDNKIEAIKGFENKDYYSILFTIKNVVEGMEEQIEDNEESEETNKEEGKLSTTLENISNKIEDEDTKKEIEELRNKVLSLEENIKLLEENKDKLEKEAQDELTRLKEEYENSLNFYRKWLSEENDKVDELKNALEESNKKIDELNNEVETLKKENEDLKKENDNLNTEIKHMRGEDYQSEFKPITDDDLNNKTKLPSFKNALITLLQSLRDKTAQLNDKITDEKLNQMRENIKNNKTIPMSDIQVIELAVSDFLNLYSSGNMNLPKPQKGEEMTLSDLSQYKNTIDKSDPSKKFASLYKALEEVITIYEENFNSEWKSIRDREAKYQQERANNKSWNGDGEMDYDTIKKFGENEMEVRGALDDLINGCRGLIPNAIMGFFISSPIYKAAEEKINSMLDVLIANEKVVEEHKKDPSLQVITLFSAIAVNNVEDDDKVKVDAASKLYNEKVDAILKNEQLSQQLKFDKNVTFEDIIQHSGVKMNVKETLESFFNKIVDVRCRLAFACLYFTMLNKPLKVEEEINGQKVDLFNLGKDDNTQNNQQQGDNNDVSTNANNGENNNGDESKPQPSATSTPQGSTSDSLQTRRSRVKKIYDYYTWQK